MDERVWNLAKHVMLVLVIVGFAAALRTSAVADGLPAGQHTAHPKYWTEISRYVTNYTPLEFDYRIENLTPGPNHDLWFSVGTSIEHIDAVKNMQSIPMPYSEWRVSAIAIAGDRIIFTAGQSGKVGIIDAANRVKYVQVVPRRDFPDLQDFIVNAGGEMWFMDVGRRSVGYRSSGGRVVENHFPGIFYPYRMRHCMGKLWAVAMDAYKGPSLFVIDEDLQPRPYLPVVPKGSQIRDIACDRRDRLWISTDNVAEWFDALGNLKHYDISGGRLAPDSDGGMWITGESRPGSYGLQLTHIARDSAITRFRLPSDIPSDNEIAVGSDKTLWLAVTFGNSPIAVTELSP